MLFKVQKYNKRRETPISHMCSTWTQIFRQLEITAQLMSPLNHHRTTTAAICIALTCLFQGSVHLLGLDTKHFIFCLILIASDILIMNKNSYVKKSFKYKVLSCYSVPGEKRCFNVTYKEPGRNRFLKNMYKQRYGLCSI